MIDALDRDLLRLMAKRIALVSEVAAVKHQHGLGIRDGARERDLLRDRLAYANTLGLPSAEIESIFRVLMQYSRDHQAALRHDVPVGVIEQIWLKRAKRAPMDPVTTARVRAQRGLVGNANQGGRRQITLLEAERWADHLVAVGRDGDPTLSPARRRANVLVRGVSLVNSRGRVLCIGAVRIQIAGETKPCHQMDEVCPGLQAVMRPAWGGGAFGIILNDGDIAVGDPIRWDDSSDAPSLFDHVPA
jgi:chorismate mutase-like protein